MDISINRVGSVIFILLILYFVYINQQMFSMYIYLDIFQLNKLYFHMHINTYLYLLLKSIYHMSRMRNKNRYNVIKSKNDGMIQIIKN
jgi:hypothetical protein